MTEPLFFERRARRPFGIAMVAVALVCLAVLIFGIDAHPLLVTLFAIIVAPALWDVLRDNRATLALNDTHLSWTAGAQKIEIPFTEIDEVVLATTMDFSQRATIQLRDGRKIRIPPQCLPGGRVLDTALEARAVIHRRSLFSF